jgi:HAD superfamily hydrolase (TIGR01509 family)
MPVRAVLFDFDGVLADTENYHVTAWERTLSRMGLDLEPEVSVRAAEEDDRDFLRTVFAGRKVLDEASDLDGYLRIKQSWMREFLSDGPRIYPGVAELIGRLEGKVRLGIVTTTWRENVETALGTAGLLGAFDRIVSKDDGQPPKPAPESYRLAMERMRLKPVSVMAVEDSPSGLASALGAGITTIALGHRRTEGEWCRGASGFLSGLTGEDADSFCRLCGVS